MNDERKLFEAAETYSRHRSIPRHVAEAVRVAFRMGAHWREQNPKSVTPITPPAGRGE